MVKFTRRELLGTGAGITPLSIAGHASGLKSEQTITRTFATRTGPTESQRPNPLVSGQILNPEGDGIESCLRIYDYRNGTIVVRTDTDQNGQFSISTGDLPPNRSTLPDIPYMIVHEKDGNLFYIANKSRLSLENPLKLQASREFLAGPLLADPGTVDGSRHGILLIWRDIDLQNPRRQTLYFEITETTFGWADRESESGNAHKIDTAPSRESIYAHRYDEYINDNPVTAGSFSVVVPTDGISVSYDPEDVPHDHQLSVHRVLNRASEPANRIRRLQMFHPNLTGVPGFYTAYDNYNRLTKADKRRAQAVENGVMLLTGTTLAGLAGVAGGSALAEGVSLIQTFGPMMAQYFGIDLDFDGDSGPLQLEESDPPPRFNPNDQDRIGTTWTNQSSSIVYSVPIRIDSNTPQTVSVDAEWVTNDLRKRVRYTQEVRLDLRGTQKDDESTQDGQQTASFVYADGDEQIDKIAADGSITTIINDVVVKGLISAPDGTFWTTRQPPLGEPAYIRQYDREGTLQTKFNAQDKGIRGIDIDSRGIFTDTPYLYVVAHKNEQIFKYSLDGTIVGRFETPAFEIVGLSLDSSGYLWLTNQNADIVYKATISNGELTIADSWSVDLASLSADPDVQSDPHLKGIAIVGSQVWLSDDSGEDIYRFNKQGEFQSRISDVGGRRALSRPTGG